MRIGSNPAKEMVGVTGELRPHRVIIPVYIPDTGGYFRRLPEVLEYCLESLHLSARDRASVTVISNGCMKPVVERLRRALDDGWIDQLILHRRNQGKVDAMIPAARGCFEELITFADADVFFEAGWVEAVETVFAAFPACASVSPAPRPEHAWNYTSATIWGALLRGQLRFESMFSHEDLQMLLRTIGGWHHDFWKTQMIVKNGAAKALVGNGHFIVTLRHQMLAFMPAAPLRKALLPGAEAHWLDIPPNRHGYWRLATPRIYAHHMGNAPDPWMAEKLAALRRNAGPTQTSVPRPSLPRLRRTRLPARLRNGLVYLLRRTEAYRLLFRPLGLRPARYQDLGIAT